MNKQIMKSTMVLLMATSLSGCAGMWDRLTSVGAEPKLTEIENLVEAENYKPVSMPMPETKPQKQYANSLWVQGSTGFFKDQRASKVGDILTVNIVAKDTALMENEMEQNRDNNSDTLGIGALAGFERNVSTVLPSGNEMDALIDVSSNREIAADGKVDRQEKIDVTMAAVVTQVLPNGNLVIEGTQEIRVSYELRRLTVRGIIRRADISSNNTIQSDKIAELRVSYGGKGVVSDVQQPRYGRQFLDILSPF